MIDHLFYPRNVDLVFAHASPESLLDMARVFRNWRERALFDTSLTYDLLCDTYLLPFPVGFEEATLHYRVLDVVTGNISGDNCLILEIARLQLLAPNLETVRLRKTTYADRPLWLPNACRVVFAALHPDHRTLEGQKEGTRYDEDDEDEEQVTGDEYTPGRNEGGDGGGYAALLLHLQQVLILSGKMADPSCVLSVLHEARDMSIPVTIVGLLPPLPSVHQGRSLVSREDAGETALEDVKVLTHGEYRTAIGKMEYATEAK